MTRTPLATLASAQQPADGKGCSSIITAVPLASAASAEESPAAHFKRKFSRQRQQQGAGQKRKADLAWLGDDTPCNSDASHHNSFRGALWSALTAPGVDEAVLSQVREADNPALPNGVITWSAGSHTCL